MKHILFFNDGMEMGGTEKLLVGLLNHLVRKDCKLTLLLPVPSEKNVLLKEISSDISVRYLYQENASHLNRKIGENLMVFYPRLFAWIKGLKGDDYDLIVCFKETFFARIFSKIRIPKILWIHNILYKRKYEVNSLRESLSVWLNKKQIKIVQKSYDHFDKVICVSDAAKTAYLDVLYGGRIPDQNIVVLYNAIDIKGLREKAGEMITDSTTSETNFILITRSSPEKRVDRLINAAARLKIEGYRFHICIIGHGMNSESMKTFVSNSDLPETITLKGSVENPYPYILKSKWSLCVSMRESFSLALLESMALNTPVITTDCGGPRDIVDGGKYGLLVENSSEGVYCGLKKVLDDTSLYAKYSQNLDEAVSRFDYQRWLKSIENLLLSDRI